MSEENKSTTGNEPKTYSEEEVQALLAGKETEYAKLKKNFDKTSSELSTFKKERDNQLSETEKQNEKIKELEEKLKASELDFNRAKITGSLAESGYDAKTSAAIANAFLDNDLEKFTSLLTESRKSLSENHSKEIEKLKMSNMKTPPTSMENMSTLDAINAEYVKAAEKGDQMTMIKCIRKANELQSKK